MQGFAGHRAKKERTEARAEAERERAHGRAVERARLLRGERVDLYRRLLSAADKAKIFECNARRVYGRLSRTIEKQSATAV